jgi:hypothetical protein
MLSKSSRAIKKRKGNKKVFTIYEINSLPYRQKWVCSVSKALLDGD